MVFWQSVDEAARTVIVFKVDQVFLSVKDIGKLATLSTAEKKKLRK